MSKRVSVDVGLEALQAAIGEWPSVADAASRLGKTPQTIHDMLDDGGLKGVRTRVGWKFIPLVSSVLPVRRVDHGKRSSSPQRAGRLGATILDTLAVVLQSPLKRPSNRRVALRLPFLIRRSRRPLKPTYTYRETRRTALP